MIRTLLSLLAVTLALPLHAQLPVKSYGQDLVDQVVAKYPGLLVIAMHAAPGGNSKYPIVASNIGRIGKEADEDDMRVITTEKTNLEVAHGGTRFEVELVLRDVTGADIGALGLVFPFKEGDDKGALEKRAIAMRDWLAGRITDPDCLAEHYPYEPLATTKTHAQKLADDVLSRHPEVIELAVHTTPPKGKDSVVVGSNFGRIGKKSEADVAKATASGQPVAAAAAQGKRYRVALALRDAGNKTIGALEVGFRYKSGDDEKALLSKAEALRDELQKRAPTVESLVELDP